MYRNGVPVPPIFVRFRYRILGKTRQNPSKGKGTKHEEIIGGKWARSSPIDRTFCANPAKLAPPATGHTLRKDRSIYCLFDRRYPSISLQKPNRPFGVTIMICLRFLKRAVVWTTCQELLVGLCPNTYFDRLSWGPHDYYSEEYSNWPRWIV